MLLGSHQTSDWLGSRWPQDLLGCSFPLLNTPSLGSMSSILGAAAPSDWDATRVKQAHFTRWHQHSAWHLTPGRPLLTEILNQNYKA